MARQQQKWIAIFQRHWCCEGPLLSWSMTMSGGRTQVCKQQQQSLGQTQAHRLRKASAPPWLSVDEVCIDGPSGVMGQLSLSEESLMWRSDGKFVEILTETRVLLFSSQQ